MTVEDAESVYWSNLEAGLGLLAVNLPTLWGYVRNVSVRSLVASVRSIISLDTLRSNQGSRTRRADVGLPEEEASTAQSNRSDVQIFRHHNASELHNMHGIEQGRPPLPDNAITGKTAFGLSQNEVE